MTITQRAKESAKTAAVLVSVLWIIHYLQLALHTDFGAFGIYPRKIWGFKGVFTAPFIHADVPHLLSNSVPLLLLTFVLLFFYRKVALRAYLLIYLLTGLMVWLFARDVFHIGASGVVYGLVSFVFWNGIFRRSLQSVVLALVVTVLYSGYFAGILPNQEGISWESHLLGGLVGIFVAYYFKSELEAEEVVQPASWELEPDTEKRPFLPPDTFEKTREERRLEQLRPPDAFSEWYSNSTSNYDA